MTMAFLKIRALLVILEAASQAMFQKGRKPSPRDLGERWQTNLGKLGRNEVKARLHALDLEIKAQLDITWGNLGGRPEVVSKAPRRTCGSYLRILWSNLA